MILGVQVRWELPGFDVAKLIGFGPTGEVWQARRSVDGAPVALKRVHAPQSGAREQLRREAALLASIAGHHVVAVHDVLAVAADVVLVLDLATESLGGVVAKRGRLTPPEVVTIVGPLAQTLAAAHRRGLSHGRISPGNVLFAADGRPMFGDFGVAAAISTTAAAGTLQFGAPAGSRGAEPSAAGDVFGLAAVAHLALTGRPPWDPDADAVIDTDAAPPADAGDRRPLSSLAPDAPSALLAALDHALALDPYDRPEAESFAAAVLRACAAAPIRLAVSGGPVRPVEPVEPVEPAEPAEPARTARTVGTVGKGPAGRAGTVGSGRGSRPTDPPVSVPQSPSPSRFTSEPRSRRRWDLGWVSPLHRLRSRAPAVVGTVALLVIAVLAGVAWGRHGGGARVILPPPLAPPPFASHPPPVAASASPSRPSSSSPPADVEAATTDWRALVARLDRTRVRALTTRDVAMLRHIYAPGSAAGVADVAMLRRLVAAGLRVRGLHVQVKDVRLLRLGRDHIRLRVVDSLSSYVLVDANGVVLRRAVPRSATPFVLTLARAAGGWRISAVIRSAR